MERHGFGGPRRPEGRRLGRSPGPTGLLEFPAEVRFHFRFDHAAGGFLVASGQPVHFGGIAREQFVRRELAGAELANPLVFPCPRLFQWLIGTPDDHIADALLQFAVIARLRMPGRKMSRYPLLHFRQTARCVFTFFGFSTYGSRNHIVQQFV